MSRFAPPLVLLALVGCTPEEGAEIEETQPAEGVPGEEVPEGFPAAEGVQAEMLNSQGENVGVVTFTPEGEGVRVEGLVYLPDVPPTSKGLHVHETGSCDAPDFQSAGGHFNPHDAPHGAPDDPLDQRHVGDLGNVEVADDGSVEIDLVDPLISLDEVEEGITGLALMIHEGEDDLESQPTGDAGGRVACGVIEG